MRFKNSADPPTHPPHAPHISSACVSTVVSRPDHNKQNGGTRSRPACPTDHERSVGHAAPLYRVSRAYQGNGPAHIHLSSLGQWGPPAEDPEPFDAELHAAMRGFDTSRCVIHLVFNLLSLLRFSLPTYSGHSLAIFASSCPHRPHARVAELETRLPLSVLSHACWPVDETARGTPVIGSNHNVFQHSDQSSVEVVVVRH